MAQEASDIDKLIVLVIAYSFFLGLYYVWYSMKTGEPILKSTVNSILLYILSVFLIPYIIRYSRWLFQNFSIELLRRATRNMGPLTFFTLDYYISDHINIKYLQYLSVIPSAIILTYLTIGFISGIHFFDYTGFDWTYHALTHWSLAFVIATLLFHSKTGNPITSLDFGFQGVMAAGWLYELPVCYVPAMFYHINYPTFIMPQIISLVILIWILYKYQFHPNKLFYATTMVFLAFSLIYGLRITKLFPTWFRKFVPRIPATAMILATTTGIRGHSR